MLFFDSQENLQFWKRFAIVAFGLRQVNRVARNRWILLLNEKISTGICEAQINVSDGTNISAFSVVGEKLDRIIRFESDSAGYSSSESRNRERGSNSSLSFLKTCSIVEEDLLRMGCHCVSSACVSHYNLGLIRVLLSVFRMECRFSKNRR